MKGEVMFVSRGQRKGRMEKNLVKWDMQDCHTEGKETSTRMNPATFHRAVGSTWHSETTPVSGARSHQTLWGVSYLPSLVKNHTPLVTAAEREAARGQDTRGAFTVSPELAAVLTPASSVSVGQHNEKRGILGLWV